MSAPVITAYAVLSSAGEIPDDHAVARAPGRITADVRALWPQAPDRLGRMDRLSAYALLVAHRVLTRAGVTPPASELAVVFGTALGCAEANERYHRALVAKGPAEGASPLLFAQTLPSAPVGEVSIAFGAHGPSSTLMAGRASGIAALAEAHRTIALHRARSVLVLAGDTVGPDRGVYREARGFRPANEALVGLLLEHSSTPRAPLAKLEYARVSSHESALDDRHPNWLGACGLMELTSWMRDTSPHAPAHFEHSVCCASGRHGLLRTLRC